MSDDFVETVLEGQSFASFGSRPDYGSGPHLLLVAAMVELARRDLSNPLYSASAQWFLRDSDIVELFAECVGIDSRSFLDG